MPQKKIPRKNYKKKNYKKKNYKMSRLISYGFPRCQLVRMVYFAQIRIDPAGTPGFHIFRANSVHDPDYTAGGHQPMYHDQYAAVYRKYKVVSSKIQVTGTNDYSDQANTMGNLIVVMPSLSPTTYGSITEACESKGVRYTQCQERRPCKVTNTFSAKKFLSLSNVKDASELEGDLADISVSGNPTKPVYFVIGAYPLYQAQNSYPACLNVRIQYNALVYDLKDQSGS